MKSLSEDAARAIVAARPAGGYACVEEVWRRAGVHTTALVALAEADGFAALGLARREALWAIRALGHNGRETAAALPLFAAAARAGAGRPETGEPAALPAEHPGEVVANDYAAIRMSLKHHPLTLLRPAMEAHGVLPAGELTGHRDGARVAVSGLVLVRQRPGSASGVIFLTLEDDTGIANVIIWPAVFKRYRRLVLSARLLRVHGRLQREGIVTHIVADRLADMSDDLDALAEGAAVEPPWARADEIRHGSRPDPSEGAVHGRKPAKGSPARHPRDNRIAIKSRDFH